MDTTKIVEKIKYGNVELKLKTENLQEKTVDPSTEVQTILPDHEYGGMSAVTINAVTSDIDTNIIPENIKDGVVILGVEGSLGELEDEILITENGIYDVRNYATANVKTEGKEDLDTELNEQEELLAELESSVEELPEKPVDKLQWKCDNLNSLQYEFKPGEGTRIGEDSVLYLLENLDTSKVTNFNYAFAGVLFQSAPHIDTSSAKNIQYMFYDSIYLTEFICNYNFSNVTNAHYFMQNCTGLKQIIIPKGTFGKDLTARYMFVGCGALETADVDFGDVKVDAYQMFGSCGEMTYINVHKMKVKNIAYIFQDCKKLVTVEGEIDMNDVTSTPRGPINRCYAIETIMFKNIKISLTIGSGTSYGHLLTDTSIINTFQELWDLTGSSTQTLTLSTPSLARTGEIYVKLIDVTDAMRAEDEYIDNKKPCVVCESTDAGAMTLREYGISKGWNIA